MNRPNGTVFKAQHKDRDELVAIRVLNEETSNELLNELTLTTKLTSTNLVRCYDVLMQQRRVWVAAIAIR